MTHLTDDQLIARLYDVADAATHAHLTSCVECTERYEAAERRRALVAGFKPLTPAQLAQQRATIAARIQSSSTVPAFLRRAWAPTLAAAALIAVGLYFSQPAEPPAAPTAKAGAATGVETIDANWYDEIYSNSELMEPRAATPIRELFELEGEAASE